MSPKHLVAAAMAALMSAPLSAQSVKAGIDAWQRSDYAAAVAIWRPLAVKGDADAEFNLGQAYRLGRGVPLNLAMAKGWFEKAANAGHLDAETTLGLLLFQNGDQVAGLKWLRRAADQGEPRALLVYGTALYNGEGVMKDHVLGYAYVSRAAAQGLQPAKDTLAQLDTLMPDGERKKAMVLAQARAKPAPAPQPQRAARASEARRPAPQLSAAKTNAHVEKAPAPARTKAVTAPGNWRIQLGAFAQRASAEALYRRVAGKPAVAGRSVAYVPAGSVTRLQVGPFESRNAAAAACRTLGTACFPVPAK